MTTISLPLAVWGEGYGQFAGKWLQAVHGLNRMPDEIVLVTDAKNAYIAQELVTHLPLRCYTLEFSDYRLWDYAIRSCTSEWLAICNVDDVFLPGALDQIEEADAAGCNLLIDKIRVKGSNHVWGGYYDAQEIPRRFTMPGAEPMKRQLYIDAGGYDHHFQFPDWALAVHMAHKSLAVPFNANTERIIFDTGDSRVTLSGSQQNPNVKAAGTAQVHELSRSLGLI